MLVQVIDGSAGEPAPPMQTMQELLDDAEKHFFDFISKERRRAARESNAFRVSLTKWHFRRHFLFPVILCPREQWSLQ